jgi:hypothetical protein
LLHFFSFFMRRAASHGLTGRPERGAQALRVNPSLYERRDLGEERFRLSFRFWAQFVDTLLPFDWIQLPGVNAIRYRFRLQKRA